VRSRVVNRKRTDLSVRVRKKVEKGLPARVPKDFVACMSGHTRFATSSMTTMDGTHPHQWTPAAMRWMYEFSVQHGETNGLQQLRPRHVSVENYITHNGDFDFYTLNGKTYDIEAIQKWLIRVTGCEMPASVDSCAVAGMVDLLRTQGCFGLSARYAVVVGLSTSAIRDDLNFPSYKDLEELGCQFADVLEEMLKTMTLERINATTRSRHSFGSRVLSKLEQSHRASLLRPMEPFLSDEEGGASLLSFIMATINAFFDNDLFMATQTFLQNAKGSFGLCVTSSLDAHRQVCLAARGQTVRFEVCMYVCMLARNCPFSETAVLLDVNCILPQQRAHLLWV
jgi:hypothetical protein